MYKSNHHSLANLLAKFRIDYTEVTVIPDVAKKPDKDMLNEFEDLVNGLPTPPTELDLETHRDKTYRQLNIAQALRLHSMDSSIVIAYVDLHH